MYQQFMYEIALFVFLSGISIATVYFAKGIYIKRKKHDNQKALDYLEEGFYKFVAILVLSYMFWIISKS